MSSEDPTTNGNPIIFIHIVEQRHFSCYHELKGTIREGILIFEVSARGAGPVITLSLLQRTCLFSLIV